MFLDITGKDIVLANGTNRRILYWLMAQIEAKLMFRERRFLR